MTSPRLLLTLLLSTQLLAQSRHPQIRSLILEAFELSKSIRESDDRIRTQNHAASLLNRIGDTTDAEKIYYQVLPDSAEPPYDLWLAWVTYGKTDRFEQYLATRKDPNERVDILIAYARCVWRMRQKQKAKQTYLAAQALLPKVTIPSKRTIANNLITQGLKYIDDDAPRPLSIETNPLPNRAPVATLTNRFPITPNSTSQQTSLEREANIFFDEKLIRQLYSSLRAGKLEALDAIINSSHTPFQKALGIASVQHILNQYNLGDLSRLCAENIPTSTPDAKLAKAEALASAATILVTNKSLNQARALLITAADLAANTTTPPIPRIEALALIAIRQSLAGFEPDAQSTIQRTIAFASTFPIAPKVWSNRRRNTTYREEVFWPILRTAVEFDQLPLANQAVTAWATTDPSAPGSLVSALLRVNDYPRALATARAIPSPSLRAKELLSVADSMLNAINAPYY